MSAEILVLHPQPSPLGGFLRIGHTGQRKLEALHASGRLPFQRVVFDAAHIREQVGLLKLLKQSGYEVVLDPNFAEMATVGRHGSAVSKLPWAHPDRPWAPGDFGPGRNADIAKMIAEFAVQYGVNIVLTASHLAEPNDDAWRSIDFLLCERLRNELDALGARLIGLDHQFILSNAMLKDAQQRQQLVSASRELPIENVWLRVSGFGATATGAGTRQFIECLRQLHQIERPIIADGAGGFSGLATLAFGAVGGICHGVGQKESFRASDWKKPASGGGTRQRIYIPELDRHFTEEQLRAIFSVKGGRSRFGCNDTSCCSGLDDMVENANAHFITQRSRQLHDISKVPEARRSEHFLLHHLDPAVRSARYGARLKINDENVRIAVGNAKSRLLRLRDALGDLHANAPAATRSRAPRFRGGSGLVPAIVGL